MAGRRFILIALVVVTPWTVRVREQTRSSTSAIFAPAPASCASLADFALPDGTITSARFFPTGPFVSAGSDNAARRRAVSTGDCQVDAVLRPSADSQIEVAVMLPAEMWNGRFVATGNGAWGGGIDYLSMLVALRDGYATAGTDTGHKIPSPDASWAIGHPEKLRDFGARAVHEMTILSKSVIQAFYQRQTQFSYWDGCSTGGRQGLVAAQKYPDDFDGISAGAPVIDQPLASGGTLALLIPTIKDPSRAVKPAKLKALNKAVVNACDAGDGVRDGIISDPESCKFDPATLACQGAESDACLTAAELETVKRAYAPVASTNGQRVSPAKWPGSEEGWTLSASLAPPANLLAAFQIAHSDAAWDWRAFDFDRDVALAEERVGVVINASNPDLSAFKAHGGKLLLYHGAADSSATDTVNYTGACSPRWAAASKTG